MLYNPGLTDTPATTPHTPPATPRFHGFDALRGGAMLLGILLHAAIAFMDRRLDGILYPLDDLPTHFAFDTLFWWIHGWRIPLFFVMAGFFAAMLARRRGPSGFIKHRRQRILYPLILFGSIILPVTFYIWTLGWLLEGRTDLDEILAVKFDDPAIQNNFIGPAHLWFLCYLMAYSVIYWVLLKCRGSKPGDDERKLTGKAHALFTSPLRPLWFALPTFLLLLADPSFYVGYHHVMPRSWNAVANELAQFVYQGWFYVVGVYLFRLHRQMQPFTKHAWLYVVLGHLAFVPGLWIIYSVRDQPTLSPSDPLMRVGLAASIALFCWLMIWGLTGLGLTVLSASRAWVRWLSDAAYWVYLIHFPIVGLLLIALRAWPIGAWWRFMIIVVVTSAVTLLSYQWGVRYTFIGRILNGPRVKPNSQTNAKMPSRQDAKQRA